jgi:Ca2+:H+ antiporter
MDKNLAGAKRPRRTIEGRTDYSLILYVWSVLARKTRVTVVIAVVACPLAGILSAAGASSVLVFVVSAIALGALASIVGDGTDQLGARLGPGATGILQSALGNLPELFISIFALQAGLITVVQAALVGSILGNSLLVLGLAFTVGGFRHGTQRFASETPKLIAVMTLLSVAAVTIPTVSAQFHTPAAAHEQTLSTAVASVLLVIFAASVIYVLRGGPMAVTSESEAASNVWPLWLAVLFLTLAGTGSAFVSNWFVEALTPATHTLGLSEGFTGLVIVAIAGNAVENVVGIQFSAQNRPDLAISVILNSSLQVALALIPALVLLSIVTGGTHLTLVMPGLLVVALALTALVTAFITYDGESTWIEGLALIGLYVIVAASFWWG